MIGSSSGEGFGQRAEQNWSWKNQSLIAVTHRLTRRVNYYLDDPRSASYVTCLIWISNRKLVVCAFRADRSWISGVIAGRGQTPACQMQETGILFCLMTVASPWRAYYFLWLSFDNDSHSTALMTLVLPRGWGLWVLDFPVSAGSLPAAPAIFSGAGKLVANGTCS